MKDLWFTLTLILSCAFVTITGFCVINYFFEQEEPLTVNALLEAQIIKAPIEEAPDSEYNNES